MYKNLKIFLKKLHQAKEIKYIKDQVSPYLDISRITDKESKFPGGGKALFFEDVKGSSFPVVTNMFGSMRRICMALGVDNLDRLGERIREYIDFNPPRNLKEALNVIPMALNLAKFFPRPYRFKFPPCQEVVYKNDAVDLSIIPVLHCWPKDAGPFITLPIIFTKSLATGKRNAGMYRMQVFDKNSTGMHWHIHKDGSHHYNEYLKAGKKMPVAVAIGADPAVVYSATAPLPRGIDEMILAGFIRKKPVKMAKCISVEMEVPAEAEFVLEGYVEPGELRPEGPFGDHTGYYSLTDDYPVFHVTAITHKKDPVYIATLVGRPPMEDCYLAKATERLFLPMLQAVMPEISDYWFPWEGVFHNIVVVSINKEYPGHAQKVISGLWGQGQMSFCKAILIVDQKINLKKPENIIKELLAKLDISSDITLTRGILDVLDHSSPFPNFGTKIGIDITTRFKDEPPRDINNCLLIPPGGVELKKILESRLPGFVNCTYWLNRLSEGEKISNRILTISIEKSKNAAIMDITATLFDITDIEMFNILILFDKEIDLSDNSLMLWKLFNNVDPGRDIIIRNRRAVIDACIKGSEDGHKREWPDELTFDV